MRSSFASSSGLTLTRTLNVRERAARRRTLVVVAVVALAIGSGMIGALTNSSRQASGQVSTSPLSYISVQ